MNNNKKINIDSLDPNIPLLGNYFQFTGKTTWMPTTALCLADMLLANHPPEFRTVLGIIGDNTGETPQAGYSALGPMYFDFDGEDIEEAINGFHGFLAKLQGLSLNLHMVRLFASGVKGFHIEIPMQCFMGRIPDDGVLNLAYLYRECAHALYVDTLDLRVFSARKGRAWRVPNRRRESGTYKVPLAVGQALNMTPESCAALVSAPRPFPSLVTPELCPDLALIYSKARTKIAGKATHKRKVSDVAKSLRSRFGSKIPGVMAALGQGRFPARTGWNTICIQLVTLAHALDIDEETTVTQYRGLINSHESDGRRYNTAAKRERELRRLHSYVDGNPTYEVSIGGLRSILPQGLPCPEWRGL
ncbi:MAG: hypothetical protein XXXNARYT_002448 [Candidatus Accumulibacter regalis]|jgi:hypothetical protein|uniref:hypothetical protein n=1 Tax=Accumulibacter sp. TaxID=2053492 RepID=UPI002618253B|nr:hypothetical protein [Accumulibacter sp.]HRE71781.1 hypothetical protein [Accumulibacter sp.]HRE86296.1 hypothetical protein [Accumulibacter sp.]